MRPIAAAPFLEPELTGIGRLPARAPLVAFPDLDGARNGGAGVRGVGTGACGPDTAPAYRVRGGTHRLAWRLTGI